MVGVGQRGWILYDFHGFCAILGLFRAGYGWVAMWEHCGGDGRLVDLNGAKVQYAITLRRRLGGVLWASFAAHRGPAPRGRTQGEGPTSDNFILVSVQNSSVWTTGTGINMRRRYVYYHWAPQYNTTQETTPTLSLYNTKLFRIGLSWVGSRLET